MHYNSILLFSIWKRKRRDVRKRLPIEHFRKTVLYNYLIFTRNEVPFSPAKTTYPPFGSFTFVLPDT